jgi:Alcohol dehydrogenase, class IV
MTNNTYTLRKSILFNKDVPNIFQMIIPHSFGKGVSKTAGDRLRGMECKRALVLFDKGVEAAGITEGIVQCVKDAGLEVVTCNMVEADPSDVSIDKITDFAKKEKIDGIVAVGGGATMDSGKILKKNLNESGPDMNVPLITVPTTSGTGAELTKAGVITDSKTGDKRGVGGYESMPDLALVDPELVLGVPARVTAACSFDVLSHAIDSTTSIYDEPIHRVLAMEAIRLMRKNYIEVYENGSDVDARGEMHLASTMAGICIGNGNVSICHTFAHAMGAKKHVPHGVCCAVFTPACLEYVAEECADTIREFAALLDVKADKEDTNKDVARKVAEEIFRMSQRVDIPEISEYYKNAEEACAELVPIAVKDMYVASCPRGLDEAGARWILERTFELAEGK